MKSKAQLVGSAFSERFIGLAADSAITQQGTLKIPRPGRAPGAGSLRLPRVVISTQFVGHTLMRIPPTPGLASLQQTVSALQKRVRALEDQLAPTVVVVRELSAAQAKAELLDYFAQNPGAYPSDAAIALRLDSAVVRDLSAELVQEGLLAG